MENRDLFLCILKKYIHPDNEKLQINEMTAEGWSDLFHMAMIHSVLPIIYDAVWQEESYQQLPEDVKMAIRHISKRDIIRQSQYTAYFLELYKIFLKNNLKPLVVKGLILRNMYEKPDYRVSGDEDVLIKKEDFDKIDQILKECGFLREEIENPKDQHEISYYNRNNGFHLELHLTLFPKESGAYGHLNRDFKNIFKRAIIEKIESVDIYTLDVSQHMLYLFCHGLKHFLHSGFGIRQLCDMVMFAETYGSSINWEEILDIFKKENMYVFVMNLLDIGEKYLGFSWEKANLSKPEEKILDSEQLLDDLLLSGVYGKSNEERNHSANITLQAAESQKSKTGLFRSLFPGYSYMCRQYPYLKKYKIGLPIAWIQRIFAYAKHTENKNIKQTVNIGNQRVGLLKKYNIID